MAGNPGDSNNNNNNISPPPPPPMGGFEKYQEEKRAEAAAAKKVKEDAAKARAEHSALKALDDIEKNFPIAAGEVSVQRARIKKINVQKLKVGVEMERVQKEYRDSNQKVTDVRRDIERYLEEIRVSKDGQTRIEASMGQANKKDAWQKVLANEVEKQKENTQLLEQARNNLADLEQKTSEIKLDLKTVTDIYSKLQDALGKTNARLTELAKAVAPVVDPAAKKTATSVVREGFSDTDLEKEFRGEEVTFKNVKGEIEKKVEQDKSKKFLKFDKYGAYNDAEIMKLAEKLIGDDIGNLGWQDIIDNLTEIFKPYTATVRLGELSLGLEPRKKVEEILGYDIVRKYSERQASSSPRPAQEDKMDKPEELSVEEKIKLFDLMHETIKEQAKVIAAKELEIATLKQQQQQEQQQQPGQPGRGPLQGSFSSSAQGSPSAGAGRTGRSSNR